MISVPGKRCCSFSSTASIRRCASPTVQSAGTHTWNWTKRWAPEVRVRRSCRPASSGYSRGSGEERLALLLWPFAVHQLVDRMAGRAPRAIDQPGCDGEAEQRVGKAPAEHLVEDQRGDHRQVQEKVGLIMDMVGVDRDRTGLADHVALVGEQREGRDHGDHRNADAQLQPFGRPAALQAIEGAPGDAQRRHGDQDDLDQRGKRFRLAMTEAMLVVGRHRRPAHAEECDQAGDEVERGVGQ